jgi:hypothetical protein
MAIRAEFERRSQSLVTGETRGACAPPRFPFVTDFRQLHQLNVRSERREGLANAAVLVDSLLQTAATAYIEVVVVESLLTSSISTDKAITTAFSFFRASAFSSVSFKRNNIDRISRSILLNEMN